MSSQNAKAEIDAEEETLKEFQSEDEIGQFTADLSTVTESDESIPLIRRALTVFTEFACAKSSRGRQPRFHRQLKARYYKTSAELKQIWKDIGWMILYLTFLVVFSCSICTAIRATAISYELVAQYSNTADCMYSWAEWGPCSQECRNGTELPYRVRRVATYSVLDMTTLSPYEGVIEKIFKLWNNDISSQCHKHAQYAPCNVLECPKNLSQIPYGNCEYTDIAQNMQQNAPCKKFLDLTKNSLVFIDNITMDLTQDCMCSEAVYPF